MTRALRPSWRRTSTLLALAAALVASPLADAPAEAAVGRSRLLRCPGGGDCWPAAFDFTPNGRKVFYIERFTGRIRIFNRDTGRTTTFHRIKNVASGGERGALGLALDPRWPDERWVYAFVSKTDGTNRIVRFRRRADGSVKSQRIFSYGSNTNHNGGAIGFGPDGKLYVVTGDLGDPSRSQATDSKAGKVLRIGKSGGRPADNPFPGSKAWSFGHRNSFGFAFDPQTGRLWQTENGPECNDEINRIRKGRNYGWGPGSSCPGTSSSGPDPVQPRWTFSNPPALTGAAFCDHCRLGSATHGSLLVGAWNDGRIRRARLDDDRTGIAGMTTIYDHPRGVLDLGVAPSGRIFFSDPRGIYRLNST